MKIHFEHKSTVFEFERRPMPEGRFRALCTLILSVIGGAVLLGLVHMLDIWGLVLTLAGMALYKLVREDFF